ncbi:ATP-dependent DNA helicase RecQ-like [Saccostrea cucullata]|uniref:ATP-dependent DNA helicase RecQ-like n=1 Tax=Saccostrea cuccullata TaxID=36930 RepID=UPI002ED4E293
MSPETLLDIDSWKDLLLSSKVYKESVCLIAIDEAHIMESWGETFRPTFARLGELRSHFPSTPFLLLTATCTQHILRQITTKIHLPNLKMFSASPDRPNIYLECQRASDIFKDLHWLFEEVKEKGIKTRKSLIYVRSLSKGGCLYRDILGHLKEHAFHEKEKTQQNSFIALYHAGMNSKDLNYILHEISKPDSVIRIAICTIAFGMGINIPDIDVVIHWGACYSIMDYWQEVGRAGRDGREAQALYFITPGSLLHTSDEMKELCRSVEKKESKCFRHTILSHFIGHNSTSQPVCTLQCTECNCSSCKCCYLCRQDCPCRNDK